MASSPTSRKAMLQRELQFYTNLVSNHEKHVGTSKAPDTRRKVLLKPQEKLGNNSKSLYFSNTIGVFPQQSVVSHVNHCQRPVIQSNKHKTYLKQTPTLLPKRSVIKPSLSNTNHNLPTVTSYKKINNNHPTVTNPKLIVTKHAVISRSVLPPQSSSQVGINVRAYKPHTTVSNQPKNLPKALTETKAISMKIDSTKYINELNKLTQLLEKRRKINSSLKNSGSLNKVSVDNLNVSSIKISSDLKSNANCNGLSKMESLKCRVENVAKTLATTSDQKVSNNFPSVLCPTKDINSSNKVTKKPCPIIKNTKTGDKLILSSSLLSETPKATVKKPLMISVKHFQSNQIPTPIRKEINLFKPSRMNKTLSLPQASNAIGVSRQSIHRTNLLQSSLANVHKLVKSSTTLQTCVLTPLAKKATLQKLSSIKKQGMKTKIIASKYKVVNKNLSNSVVVSSPRKFPKHKLTASSNFFSKGLQSNVVKKLNSKHKVVNIVKTPRQMNSTLLKTSTPRTLMHAKSALKKRKFSSSGTTPRPNGQFQNPFSQKHVLKPKFITKHKVNNYLIKNNVRSSSRTLSTKKSNNHAAVNSKFKVVNRPVPSKKLSKSPKVKRDVVRRTKSGVDVDLLLELAAEKEQLEKENGTKPMKKRAVLLKRVYKTKNAIVNKHVCSSTGTKVAKMIKAKYSSNRRNAWQKQLVSKKYHSFAHVAGHHYRNSFQRTPAKQFYNGRIKRNYFKHQTLKHKTKFSRYHAGLLHCNKKYPKSFIQQDHIRNKVKHAPISKVLASRVLHRSINRVLTASVKKELKKSSKVNTYCMFYNRFGRCNKGLKCVYIHDPSKIAVCTRFLRGTCKNEKCLFSHEINPGKMAICSFFLLGSCTKIDCPYRHETLSADAQLCKAFVQGYCPDGKQCKKAHVLVCPKYIQGLCDKGDACAFPHPPPKEKKNFIPKPVEKNETPAEAEDFMEKVSRYFQPVSGQDTRTSETTVVPKRQIIPEQPSFIAL